jgi:predicted ATPase
MNTVRDKRIVTLVYTDMEGSTRLLGALQDAFLPVLERQRVILGAATAAHGGAGYATGGDGCVFLFGSPSSAVVAAVEAQRALAVEQWPAGVSVRVRMAIHAGEVADLGDELFGMALHHVSRMLGVTHGGQVLLSGAAVGLLTELPPGITLRDLGSYRLRDIVRPVQLHQAVADGIPESFPPQDAATSRSGTLPAPTTSFVGRERQLEQLVDLLATRRLVTLTGAGGSGKTRLALEVARRLQAAQRDGVRLVELAGLWSTEVVPDAMLGALGMREPPAGTSATEALCAALADRALLLVLDNCEHVVAGVAALVSSLLAACAGLRVLATSREPLRVTGEVERLVPPLDRPAASTTEPLDRLAAYDAVRLLVERGSDVRPGFRLTEGNATAVAGICAGLEGLPLAIELVAARLRTLSPEQLAARLGEQLDLLTDGGRTRPDRQQTMRATLDWSHQLLTPDEQIVFRRLSLFAGGFTLDAAEQVADGHGVDRAGVADAVERLAGRSLVAVDHDRDEPRLHMLEPIRQYAAELLREANERDLVVRRHLEWVVSLAAKAGRGFMREPSRWSARLRDEQDNVRQAMESALAGVDPEAALRIAAALAYPWFTTGQPEAPGWVGRALDQAIRAPDRLRAGALLAAGILAQNALDYDRATSYLRGALALFRQLGRPVAEAWTLLWLGRAAMAVDIDARTATSWFEEALCRFREVAEPTGIGWCLVFLGDDAYDRGDFEAAAIRATEAQAIGTEGGVPQVVLESKRILGLVAWKRGEYAEAEQLFADVAAAYREAGNRWQLGSVLGGMVWFASERGQQPLALERLSQVLRLSRELGTIDRMRWAVEIAIRVLWRPRPHVAAQLFGATEAVQGLWLHGWAPQVRAGLEGQLARADLADLRVAGRSLSLERAVDLALRVVEEELAAASAAAIRAGGGAAGSADTPRRQGP